MLVGANGPNYYITASAAARIDVHEQLHVNSSKSIHDANVASLEARISQHTGQDNAKTSGATEEEAINALKAYINWNTIIGKFRTQDTSANTPMGTIDTQELAAADFIQDKGPRQVGGVNYANYIDTP